MSESPDAGSSPGRELLVIPAAGSADDPESTVGTGSVFAIGCTLLMMIILLIGVAIFISRQVN